MVLNGAVRWIGEIVRGLLFFFKRGILCGWPLSEDYKSGSLNLISITTILMYRVVVLKVLGVEAKYDQLSLEFLLGSKLWAEPAKREIGGIREDFCILLTFCVIISLALIEYLTQGLKSGFFRGK